MLFGKRKRIVKRILIVEDEPLTAFDNETMLGDAGYEIVATVDDFDEAIEGARARAGRPDPQRRAAAQPADRNRSRRGGQGARHPDPVRDRPSLSRARPKSRSAACSSPIPSASCKARSTASTGTSSGEKVKPPKGLELFSSEPETELRGTARGHWSAADPLLAWLTAIGGRGMATAMATATVDEAPKGLRLLRTALGNRKTGDHAGVRLRRGPALHLADRHAQRLARRVGDRPRDDRRAVVDRPRLRVQVPVVAAGRPGAACRGWRGSGGGAAG